MNENNGFDAAADDDPELTEAVRAGLRQAGYHVLRAGYELLAGVSAFLEAIGGAADADADSAHEPQGSQRIEVE